jgi:hypothetical protein
MAVRSRPTRKPIAFKPGTRGFALVVTLSLMILLTVVAVGLLGLSAVSLRSSSQGAAQAEARANARLALMLALGELQKYAGPDRAVTATSEILATSTAAVAKPVATGVWESWWDFNPNASPDYKTEKTSRFRRWLVSSSDMEAPNSLDFAMNTWTGKTVGLVDKGSLGTSATAAAKVTAGLVPISRNGKVHGSYAWHVADESVKARVNLYRDPGQNATLAQRRALLAGHRPDTSVMKSPAGQLLEGILPTDFTPDEFTNARENSGKIIDLEQAELLDGAKGRIKPFRNDITPYSLGVMADVRGGGLKQDLTSMFEMGNATTNMLPIEFNGRKLYQSTHGITGVSDPYWSALVGYYNSFRKLANPETNPTFALQPNSTTIDPVPSVYNLGPVIAKVDTIFSLVARPCTEIHWFDYSGGNNGVLHDYDYLLGMVVTPVVTLHNPYNVNISFHKMLVNFFNLPVAFNFTLISGGVGPPGMASGSQSRVPGTFESLNTMVQSRFRGDKSFVVNIANWMTTDPLSRNSEVAGPIVMKPGQTLICGPVLPPGSSLRTDSRLGSNTLGFDWENDLTAAIKAQPSYIPGLGFEAYGGGLKLRDTGINPKVSLTKVTDRFYVEFQAQRPSWYLDDFTTQTKDADPSFTITAQVHTHARRAPIDYARLEFNYKDDTRLKKFFDNRVFRYPPTGSLTGTQCAAPGGITYGAQGAYVHPFAIFSACARTTNGGVYETGKRTKATSDSHQVNLLRDGRLAGKPFLFHNPVRTNLVMDLSVDKPATQAYELNFQPFLSKGDYADYMDVEGNRVPALTGNKTTTGIKAGSYLELPSGPLQTLADFRRSNALTTSFPPHFVQPVANSLLHPLMSSDKVIETNPGITSNTMLDHSVLSNHALYDRFYFSTFATRGNTRPDAVFEQFMNGVTPLASQAFQSYLPYGKTVASAKDELFAAGAPKEGAYKIAGEYQMIRGPFNVNSTSVQAWKAMLAAINKSQVTTLWARTSALETRKAVGTPISPMSLVNGGAIPGTAVDPSKIDNPKTNDWNGYRELTEPELDKLATEIVAEVRERGPFLSMSEFVNRQVGPAGPLTMGGALEAAIVRAEINEKQNATLADSYLNQVPIQEADISDPKLYSYKTPAATTGNPAAGAPGWVSQGDLLRILEPAATVRGDTFVIRAYGEARDADGNITAHAHAEAVVQRVPEYVDPTDRPALNAAMDPTAKAANRTFGRRIQLVSFRWLSNDEI